MTSTVVATIAFGMGMTNRTYMSFTYLLKSIGLLIKRSGAPVRRAQRLHPVLFVVESWRAILRRRDRGCAAAARVRRARCSASPGLALSASAAGRDGESLQNAQSRDGAARSLPCCQIAARQTRAASAAVLGASIDGELLTLLKSLRLHLARENGVPAYLIFNDATLLEMAARKPRSEADLLQVPGVGPAKLAKYGAAFLNCSVVSPDAGARRDKSAAMNLFEGCRASGRASSTQTKLLPRVAAKKCNRGDLNACSKVWQ
jgi:hypothetical protein